MAAALFKFRAAEPFAKAETWGEMFTVLAVPAFALNAKGEVAAWNGACERLTGLKRAEVLGTRQHWRGFYRAERACLADVALQGGEAGSLYAAQAAGVEPDHMRAENWCDLPSSGRRYLAIDAMRVRDRAGAVVAVVETLQDITQYKRLEEELKAQAQADEASRAEREAASAALG